MHIPEDVKFSQSALLIVSGTQVAKLYFLHAQSGELEELGNVDNKLEEYEVHNETAKPGTTYGRDLTHVNQQTIVRRDFDNELKEQISQAQSQHDIPSIYIFCPGEVEKEIINSLPPALKDKVKQVIHGNYVKTHLIELVKKISR